MKTTLKLLALSLLAPGLLSAQEDPVERLRQVLPAEQSEYVIALVEDALSKGLPGLAVAERALEGVAKGRSGEEVLAAASALAGDLAIARDAIQAGGRTPDASEIEAGATAVAFGVDGEAVSALASSAPSGRSLAVPLAVIGALVDRGLPADEAITAVHGLLEARANDLDLIDMPGEASRMLAQGMAPGSIGLALASRNAGFAIPPMVPITPPGPPSGVPTNGGEVGDRPTPPTPPIPPRPNKGN